MPKTEPFDQYADEYDDWFVINKYAFQSELNAIKKTLPENGDIIEVGIGSGIFAAPLRIKEGIDPSEAMREKAKKRDIRVMDAVAENLPYADQSKDAVLIVTTICFVDDIYKSFYEVHRVLKDDGYFIIGFVDKNSPVGKFYLKHKDENVFYKDAIFWGTEELYEILKDTGFKINNTYQTVFGKIEEINKVQDVLVGYGQGSFVVIKAQKNKVMNTSNRVNQIKKSAIHEMTRLSKQYDDVAFLSWAKPTTGTPKHINDAVIEAINKGLTGGYSQSEGLPELREEIVKKLKRDNNIDVNISQIIVTVGAIEGLAASVLATIDPGDEVILPTPTYSTHITQVKLASGIPVLVPLIEEENFALDIEAIKQAITPRTKAIMFCTPSNPTGTVFPESTLRDLGKIALEHNLIVITDEAYEYFTFDDNKHFSIASISELSKNVITNYTFTKTYAMTGWRVGYLYADEEIITQIKKAHIPLAICAPVASQYAAIGALKGSQDCIEEFKLHYLKARNLMCERLDILDSVFEYNKPEGSYLMLPKIIGDQGNDSITFSRNLLSEARVSTTPGIAFGPTGENHIRLSFCVPEEIINKAFDRMEKYFRKNR